MRTILGVTLALFSVASVVANQSTQSGAATIGAWQSVPFEVQRVDLMVKLDAKKFGLTQDAIEKGSELERLAETNGVCIATMPSGVMTMGRVSTGNSRRAVGDGTVLVHVLDQAVAPQSVVCASFLDAVSIGDRESFSRWMKAGKARMATQRTVSNPTAAAIFTGLRNILNGRQSEDLPDSPVVEFGTDKTDNFANQRVLSLVVRISAKLAAGRQRVSATAACRATWGEAEEMAMFFFAESSEEQTLIVPANIGSGVPPVVSCFWVEIVSR